MRANTKNKPNTREGLMTAMASVGCGKGRRDFAASSDQWERP